MSVLSVRKGGQPMATVLYAEVYSICFIVVALLLHWMYAHGTDSTQERWLRRVLISFLFSFAGNLLYTLLGFVHVVPELVLTLSYILKSIFHIGMCVGVFSWCGYAAMAGYSMRLQSKLAMRLLLVAAALPVLGVLTNFKTHWLFELTEARAYVRHEQYNWQMGYLSVVSLCFAWPLVTAISREFENTRKSHLMLTASFPLCLLLAWLLSVTFTVDVPIICVCVMIELLCLYVDTSNRQISMDKLTQVNNRQNLLGFLEYKLQNHEESMFLLMIDVDYFKDINDTYGHLEGDEALVQVARVLKQSCSDFERRPYIARYGGDEFIILLEGSRAEADRLCERIHENLTAICRKLNKPYTLSLSIGLGRWHPDMTSKDFIAAADNELYTIKHNRPPRPGSARGH